MEAVTATEPARRGHWPDRLLMPLWWSVAKADIAGGEHVVLRYAEDIINGAILGQSLVSLW